MYVSVRDSPVVFESRDYSLELMRSGNSGILITKFNLYEFTEKINEILSKKIPTFISLKKKAGSALEKIRLCYFYEIMHIWPIFKRHRMKQVLGPKNG